MRPFEPTLDWARDFLREQGLTAEADDIDPTSCYQDLARVLRSDARARERAWELLAAARARKPLLHLAILGVWPLDDVQTLLRGQRGAVGGARAVGAPSGVLASKRYTPSMRGSRKADSAPSDRPRPATISATA